MSEFDPLDDDLPDRLAPDEPDEATFDMFGAPAPTAAASSPAPLGRTPEGPEGSPPQAAGGAYTVLARKYRPRTFEDLIGQEGMVRTLTNAFRLNRIAHAFMLTGVRGVGKTTTARLLARALNYETDTVHAPSVELTELGRNCQAIIDGRHIDVLEMDAASHTGIDNIRELTDSVRYAPVEARNKVIILDEVHMLSKPAFNALLKTLEEPPPHVKFIFATTEIRKVPVTILSRCQRFDLRRVEPEVLTAHLRRICAAEAVGVDDDALALIARAAEGSVRDALSLLDQAIVQAEPGAPVGAELVRDMLGLADRGATIELFQAALRGDMADALRRFRTLYGYGADPAQIVYDLLEHTHGATVSRAVGPEALSLPRDQAAALTAIGAAVSPGVLARLWQMLLKAYDEVRQAPDAAAAAEMALVRLCYAADLPGPEEALRKLQDGQTLPSAAPQPPPARMALGGGGSTSAALAVAAPTPTPQPASPSPQPSLATYDDVLALIASHRDVALRLDVERFVRPIAVRGHALHFEPAPGAPSDLSQRLVGRLRAWTGDRWMVVQEPTGGAPSAYERDKQQRADTRAGVEADPFVRAVMDAFPGAEIVAVRDIAPPPPPPADIAPDEAPPEEG